MARPPLPPHERKDDRLPNIRVTASQRAFVEQQAATAGIPLVEFCRRAIFAIRIQPRQSDADAALIVELNRIGVNLNQIAHRFNAGRGLPDYFPRVMEKLEETLEKVSSDDT